MTDLKKFDAFGADIYSPKCMERYKSYCASLAALEEVFGRDLSDPFVISGTVQKFSLTFDISWKVMKDILTKVYAVTDFTTGSPRDTLRAAASVGWIDDDDWMYALMDRYGKRIY